MSNRSIEIRVGLTVFFALLILIGGIYLTKKITWKANYVTFSITFPNSSGLEIGDPVTLMGVKKGKVDNIRISDNKVLVRVIVSKGVTLYDDASAIIKSQELMGGKSVELLPGHSGKILSLSAMKKPLKGQVSIGLEDLGTIIGNLYNLTKDTISKIDTALNTINTTLLNKNLLSSIIHTVADLEQTSADLKDLVHSNKNRLSQSFANMDTAVVAVKNLIIDHKVEVDSTLQRLMEFSGELERITQTTREITDKISKGEGTVGKLIQDQETYDRLTHAVASIDSITTDLKTHLGRYLHGADLNFISLFNF